MVKYFSKYMLLFVSLVILLSVIVEAAPQTHKLYFIEDGQRTEVSVGDEIKLDVNTRLAYYRGPKHYTFVFDGTDVFSEIQKKTHPKYTFENVNQVTSMALVATREVYLSWGTKSNVKFADPGRYYFVLENIATGETQNILTNLDPEMEAAKELAKATYYPNEILPARDFLYTNVFNALKGMSRDSINKIVFYYKDMTENDLFEYLGEKLSDEEYPALIALLNLDPDSLVLEIHQNLKSNNFIFGTENADLNSKLVSLYESKGHLVYFMFVEEAYNKEFYANVLKKIRNKIKADKKGGKIPTEGYPMILVYDSSEELLSFEDDSPYSNSVQTMNYVMKNGLENARATGIKDVKGMVPYYVEAFIEYVDAVELTSSGKIVDNTELSIEFEKRDDGIEYRGLTRKYGNKLKIIVRYPVEYLTSKPVVKTGNQDGTISFGDCEIQYKLDNTIMPKTKIDRIGKLEIDESSMGETTKFELYYHPPKSLPENLDADSFTVDILCDGIIVKTQTKQITTYEPIVIMVHGLWPPTVGYKKLLPFLTRLYGEVHYFDYSDTNVQDIRISAAGLKKFVAQKVAEKENIRVKTGKINIVAHSMGGVVSRYYISDLGGGDEVGMLLTYGTPHIGTPSFGILLGAVPYDYKTKKFVADKQTLADYDALTKALRDLPGVPSNYGGLGTAIFQLTYKSEFLRNGFSDFPTEKTKLIMYAGRKPIIPDANEAWVLITTLLEKAISVPPSMGDTLKNFILSLSNKDTDGLVPVDSALWKDGGPTGTRVMRQPAPKNHVSLSFHEPMWYTLLYQLKGVGLSPDEQKRIIEVGSPVNIYVVDKAGNIVGKKGELKEEIDNVRFFEYNEDGVNQQSIHIEGSDDYSFVLEAFDNGSFSFSITDISGGVMNTIYYSDVNITDKSKAFVAFDNKEYDLELDYDGDGNVDKIVQPEYVDSIDLSEEDEDYSKEFTVDMDVPQKNNNHIWIAVGAIAILIGIIIIIKRKQNV
jgi:hypothetical protein